MKVEVNAGIADELKRDQAIQRELLNWARKVATTAKAKAPFLTGHYVRSIFVRRLGNGTVWVGAHDFKAWWVEYGAYGRSPPFVARAPLRKALRVHGLRYTPTKHDSIGG
jgi:hypothetical protein